MTVALASLPDWGLAFLLTFARLGAIVMLLPGFGEQYFPRRLRLALALMLTLALLPLVRSQFGAPAQQPLPALALLLLGEVVLGLFVGLTIRFVASALATAGTVIGQQMGLGFVTQIDPTQGGQSVLLANFLTLFGIATLFALDLHHVAIAALHDSYRLFPPGLSAELPVGEFSMAGVRLFAASFTLAIQISAPFLVAGLVFQVALGVLSRLMPQLQILFLATPAQLLAGFALLAFLLTAIASWYGAHVEQALGRFLVR